MTSTTAVAECLIRCPRQTVWAMLADPGQHHRFDGTGMVRGLASPVPRAVGDVFRMDMTWTDGHTAEEYQSDNHVTRYVPGHVIAWATALPDEPPLGWTWTYELTDVPGGAAVRLSYDWTDTPPQHIERFGVPITDETGLAHSLELLERACVGAAAD